MADLCNQHIWNANMWKENYDSILGLLREMEDLIAG